MSPAKKNRPFIPISIPLMAPGYRFSGVASGIKESGKLDLGLIYSEAPAKAVALFTTNRVQAAPVLQGKEALKDGRLQAVVVNSGNANAVTGKGGLQHARQMAAAVAKGLDLKKQQVLVSSTGKIGAPLPIKEILSGIPRAIEDLAPKNLVKMSKAIMTTDRFPKVVQKTGKVGPKQFTVTGIAKGAGMIEPHMATMLAYLLTDLELPLSFMKKLLQEVAGLSFNAITVDGDTSTNDTLLLMANGTSGISLRHAQAPGAKLFARLLLEVCEGLAHQMVADGEGATKVVEVAIQGARTSAQAKKMAYAVGRSLLVKTSFFGEDPNWGRVLAALGYSGETFDPTKVDIYYGAIPLLRRGVPTAPANEAKAHQVMKEHHFKIKVALNQGRAAARIFTSDLGYQYVKINSEYRT